MNKQKIINDIVILKKGITSEENRYIDKRCREILKLQIPTVSKKLPDFLNSAEIYHLRNNCNNAFDNVLIDFELFTGLRINEANNQLIQDIDLNNNQMKVSKPKFGKDRQVPINTNLKKLIITHLNGRRKGYLFCKKNGSQYTKRALQKRISKIIDQCNFTKKITTHSLRHTFACLLLANGMAKEKIQILMGHSSIKTTEIYAKMELGSVKEEFIKILDNQ